jgi:hypothetical protein
MTVETDYNNANILVKRGDTTIHSFTYKEFVPASEIKKINDIKNVIAKIYKKEANDEVQAELEKAEADYFNTILSIAVENPIPHEQALEKFSLPEINAISEEAYIFLVTWSSTEGVKQYGQSLAKQPTTKKDTGS